MQKSIKESSSNESVRKKLGTIKRFIIYGICKNTSFKIQRSLRRIKNKGNLSRIQSLKNTESGRCFIIATGPSLTYDDLNKLKNEVTFGCNSLCDAFLKTGWETTYFGIQDINVYKKFASTINAIKTSIIFYNFIGMSSIFDKEAGRYLKDNDKAIEYPLFYLNHLYNSEKLNTKFSDDINDVVYDGYTIVFSLIQIAVYMGFREIYLIGTDCNYSLPTTHFIDNGINEKPSTFKGNRMIYSYEVVKEYADKHDVHIYNVTRGGMLEVFERKNLDEVLGE